jgi:hypothetical protein
MNWKFSFEQTLVLPHTLSRVILYSLPQGHIPFLCSIERDGYAI